MGTHSIHHVTAVTSQIRQNLAYYTGTLGLRLVKRSVNQDDVSAYHLFYADAVGTPGTDMTFFDWPSIGGNVAGAGTIARTTFRIRNDAMDWWRERLTESGSAPVPGEDETGRPRIHFTDPEGQRLELVGDDGLPSDAVPWDAVVPASMAIRGILGVDLESARPESTARVLREVLGYRPVVGNGDSDGGHTHLLEADAGPAYGRIRVLAPRERQLGRVGAGGVHHVAFRVRGDEELLELAARVEREGLRTSGFVDRYYFHSIYFREPGGILFELATDGPGFTSDEPMDELGERLALPPFLESQRERIEVGLKPLD
jgi:glyoxalase family protein